MKLTGATKEATKFTFEVVTGRHKIYRGLDQIATADDNESAQLIIDALNERERLRGIAKEALRFREEMNGKCGHDRAMTKLCTQCYIREVLNETARTREVTR